MLLVISFHREWPIPSHFMCTPWVYRILKTTGAYMSASEVIVWCSKKVVNDRPTVVAILSVLWTRKMSSEDLFDTFGVAEKLWRLVSSNLPVAYFRREHGWACRGYTAVWIARCYLSRRSKVVCEVPDLVWCPSFLVCWLWYWSVLLTGVKKKKKEKQTKPKASV